MCIRDSSCQVFNKVEYIIKSDPRDCLKTRNVQIPIPRPAPTDDDAGAKQRAGMLRDPAPTPPARVRSGQPLWLPNPMMPKIRAGNLRCLLHYYLLRGEQRER